MYMLSTGSHTLLAVTGHDRQTCVSCDLWHGAPVSSDPPSALLTTRRNKAGRRRGPGRSQGPMWRGAGS